MGLFNFLKKTPERTSGPDIEGETIATLAMGAVNSPRYRSAFFKKLLESELFGVIPSEGVYPSFGVLMEETQFRFLSLDTGHVAIFTNKYYIEDALQQAAFIQMKGETLLKAFATKPVAIDPFCFHGLNLSGELIQQVLSGKAIDSPEECEVPESRIAIDLKNLFASMPMIEAAHLSLVKNSPRHASPHWILGIYADEKNPEYLTQKIGESLKASFASEAYMDVVDLHDKRSHFLFAKGSKPFYSRHNKST
jgi:hypothetical protein